MQNNHKVNYNNMISMWLSEEILNHVKIKKGLFSVTILTQQNNVTLEKIKNCFPNFVSISEQKNGFKISKADLIKLHSWWKYDKGVSVLAGNKGVVSDLEEYSRRLLITLFAFADTSIKQPFFNSDRETYKNVSIRKYQHPSRKPAGKAQQVYNWLVGNHEGRLDQSPEELLSIGFGKEQFVFSDINSLTDQLLLEKGEVTIKCQDNSALQELYNLFLAKNKSCGLKIEGGSLKGTYKTIHKFCEYIVDNREKSEALLVKQQKELMLNTAESISLQILSTPEQDMIDGFQVAKRILSDPVFLKKFAKGKGVVQTEFYMAHLQFCISMAIENIRKNVVIEGLQEYVIGEIELLLPIRDFVINKQLVKRQPVVNITRKETKELFDILKVDNKDERERLLDKNTVVQILSLNCSENIDELCEFCSTKQVFKREVEADFLNLLTSHANKNTLPQINDVKISTALRVRELIYQATSKLPLSSLWLSFVNPANYRVTTGYKRGFNPYVENRVINESDVSRYVVQKLQLKSQQELRTVAGAHEAGVLKDDFRKSRNMMGAKEKFLYKISRNRLVWFPICVISFVITLALAVTSRVLIGLGVIAPTPINFVLNEMRGMTESFALIVGLDTVLDLFVLRVLDFPVLLLKYLDRYLLGSTIRSTLRLVVGIVGDIFSGVKHVAKSAVQSVITYGVLESSLILVDNVKSGMTLNNISKIPQAVLNYLKDKIVLPEERGKSLGYNVPIVSAVYHLIDACKGLKKNAQTSQELFELAKNNDGNLNNSSAIDNSKAKDITEEAKKLSKRLFVEDQTPVLGVEYSSMGLDSLANCNIQKQIGVLQVAINHLNKPQVKVALEISQPVFKINNIVEKTKLQLADYKLALSYLKDQESDLHDRQKENVQIALKLLHLESLSNARHIMQGINTLSCQGLPLGSETLFDSTFGDQGFERSKHAKEVVKNLELNYGGKNIICEAGHRFAHFVQEFQNPKDLALAFAISLSVRGTSIGVAHESLAENVHHLTGAIEHAMQQGVPVSYLAESVHYFYENAEMVRDAGVLVSQSINALCASDGNKKAENRVKNTVNTVSALLLTILGINALKTIIIERGYGTREALQRCYAPYFISLSLMFGLTVVALKLTQVKLSTASTYSLYSVVGALFLVGTCLIIASFAFSKQPREECVNENDKYDIKDVVGADLYEDCSISSYVTDTDILSLNTITNISCEVSVSKSSFSSLD